jgi:tRNA(Ile)-lysidine synthase
LLEVVENFLVKYKLLNCKNTFLIGFSGGVDSLCLLDIMFKLSKKHNFKVVALHLNHNWRGEESLREQENCFNIASSYGIEFITKTLDKSVKVSENSARDERYKFFEENANRYSNSYILTAHNLSDNVETIIYRLAKGTGIKGLNGIPEYIEKNGVRIIRPILSCSRDDIEGYCKNINFTPNYDSSNESMNYKRNFIRKKIIPLLKQINPLLDSAVSGLCQIAIDNEIIMNDILSNYFCDGKIFCEKFFSSKIELKKKIIHKFLIEKYLEYDSKKISEIISFLSDRSNYLKKYSLTTNLWLIFNEEFIYTTSNILKNMEEILIDKSCGSYETFNGDIFEIVKTSISGSFPKETDLTAYVSLANIKFPLTLRTRRDGDIIQPFGMRGCMKLKKYLNSKKIPKEKRDNLILLASNHEILWVIGVGISDKLKVAKDDTYVFKYKKKELL